MTACGAQTSHVLLVEPDGDLSFSPRLRLVCGPEAEHERHPVNATGPRPEPVWGAGARPEEEA